MSEESEFQYDQPFPDSLEGGRSATKSGFKLNVVHKTREEILAHEKKNKLQEDFRMYEFTEKAWVEDDNDEETGRRQLSRDLKSTMNIWTDYSFQFFKGNSNLHRFWRAYRWATGAKIPKNAFRTTIELFIDKTACYFDKDFNVIATEKPIKLSKENVDEIVEEIM